MSLAEWVTPEYWRQLLPNLHIDDRAFLQQAVIFDIDEANGNAFESKLIQEGYLQFGPLNWEMSISDMANAIVALENHQWMTVFAFLYDEYWLLFHKLRKILARLLGPDYKLHPEFWAWHINPKKGDSGWKPHRDKTGKSLMPGGGPTSLTVWIPLTDATPLNGCIYAVPRSCDPTYNTEEHDTWKFEYADIRALPAAAGSVLAWNSELIHWGARSSPLAPTPRISAGYTFQRGDIPPFAQPLLDNGRVPSFKMRLKLVALQMMSHSHMYPLSPDFENVAQHFLQKT